MHPKSELVRPRLGSAMLVEAESSPAQNCKHSPHSPALYVRPPTVMCLSVRLLTCFKHNTSRLATSFHWAAPRQPASMVTSHVQMLLRDFSRVLSIKMETERERERCPSPIDAAVGSLRLSTPWLHQGCDSPPQTRQQRPAPHFALWPDGWAMPTM